MSSGPPPYSSMDRGDKNHRKPGETEADRPDTTEDRRDKMLGNHVILSVKILANHVMLSDKIFEIMSYYLSNARKSCHVIVKILGNHMFSLKILGNHMLSIKILGNHVMLSDKILEYHVIYLSKYWEIIS
jgi:hypothetical protein